MNVSAHMNATLPANQAALPDSWIEKVFQRFEDFYGAKWAAQYGSFPRDRVKRTWAEELSGFAEKPEAIGRALKNLGQFPPTLPEFQTMCREAARAIGGTTKALPHKLTGEDHDRIREAAEAAIGSMKAKHRDGIDFHWATHPRSHAHLKFIFDAAKNDRRFCPCVAEMKSNGVVSEDGALLKIYRDGAFVRV